MMNKNSDMLLKVVIAVAAVALIGYLLYTSKASVTQNNEHFYAVDTTPTPTATSSPPTPTAIELAEEPEEESVEQTPAPASEELEDLMEPFANPSPTEPNRYPKDCFPKDQLTSTELLPANEATTQFAQLVPNNGQNKGNFLTAGYHVGINTVGQTLRNANRGLRSDPPNPQVKVSPWMQTTIEPDSNRKPLEIGGFASCQ